MPEGAPDYTLDQFMKGDAPELEKMLQTMLADRFKLVVHRETSRFKATRSRRLRVERSSLDRRTPTRASWVSAAKGTLTSSPAGEWNSAT